MSTPKSVIEKAKKAGARMVDVKFVDTFGTWQHFTVPIGELTEEVFEEGFGFDGSSIRGWKSIEASDMLAMPDPNSAFIDPFMAVPTLSVTCTIAETGTREAYNRDPRGIAQRAEAYLKSTGLADTAISPVGAYYERQLADFILPNEVVRGASSPDGGTPHDRAQECRRRGRSGSSCVRSDPRRVPLPPGPGWPPRAGRTPRA